MNNDIIIMQSRTVRGLLVALLIAFAILLAMAADRGICAAEVTILTQDAHPGDAFALAMSYSDAPATGSYAWSITIDDTPYWLPDGGSVMEPCTIGAPASGEIIAAPLPSDWGMYMEIPVTGYVWPDPDAQGTPDVGHGLLTLYPLPTTPTPIPPTPTPNPTPDYNQWVDGCVQGHAIFQVVGAEHIPSDSGEKGIIARLRGYDGYGMCRTMACIRHRGRCLHRTCQDEQGNWHCTALAEGCDDSGTRRADYQAKGGARGPNGEDIAADEVHYFSTQPLADGEWHVSWYIEGEATKIEWTAPNGTAENLEIPVAMAFQELAVGGYDCFWINWPAECDAELIEWHCAEEGIVPAGAR